MLRVVKFESTSMAEEISSQHVINIPHLLAITHQHSWWDLRHPLHYGKETNEVKSDDS